MAITSPRAPATVGPVTGDTATGDTVTDAGRRPVGALLGPALGVAVVLGALLLLLVAGRWASTSTGTVGDLVWIVSFLTFPVVGILLTRHRPDLAVGWVYLGIGVAQVAAVGLQLVGDHLLWLGSEGGASWAVLLSNLAFGTAWSLATTFALLTFPAGDVPLRFRHWLLRLSAALLGVLLVGYALASGPLDGAPALTNPLGVDALAPWARLVGDGASFALLAVTVLALALLVLAWRRSTGTARARLTWLTLGAVVALLAGAAGALLLTGGGPAWIGSLAEAAVVAALPTVTGIAVLRTGLLDVTVVLNRTIVYAVLTGLVLATYFATLALVTGLLGEGAGRGASLLASALVTVFLVPVKDRVQRLVERSLYGDRAEPYRVLADLAARLERTSAVDDLITTVTDTVQRTLKVPFVRVVVGDDAGPSVVDEVPQDAVVLPLVAHGRREGSMVVGRRSGQRDFTARELQLLEDLARQVAREVRMARLADDLQQSRERLVRAREEERVRVRRDLHDGIGPTLAAATLQVDVLRDRWQDDDPRVGQLLDKVKAGLVSSVDGVRQVVDGLRPPALDELGLAGVLREHASSLQDAGLAVVVHAPPSLEVRSAAAEVAAYRIVTESLTNVVRHARATRVEVSLGLTDDQLLIEVRDDGVGPGDAAVPGGGRGVGVRSMRERASELGGSLTIAAGGLDGRGTVVTARLPVGGEP